MRPPAPPLARSGPAWPRSARTLLPWHRRIPGGAGLTEVGGSGRAEGGGSEAEIQDGGARGGGSGPARARSLARSGRASGRELERAGRQAGAPRRRRLLPGGGAPSLPARPCPSFLSLRGRGDNGRAAAPRGGLAFAAPPVPSLGPEPAAVCPPPHGPAYFPLLLLGRAAALSGRDFSVALAPPPVVVRHWR